MWDASVTESCCDSVEGFQILSVGSPVWTCLAGLGEPFDLLKLSTKSGGWFYIHFFAKEVNYLHPILRGLLTAEGEEPRLITGDRTSVFLVRLSILTCGMPTSEFSYVKLMNKHLLYLFNVCLYESHLIYKCTLFFFYRKGIYKRFQIKWRLWDWSVWRVLFFCQV